MSFKKLLLAPILLIGLAALAIGLLIGSATTPEGTRRIIDFTLTFMPGETRVLRIEGVLLGDLVIQNLSHVSDAQSISVDRLELNWSPAKLLRGELHVQRLILQGLRFTQGKTPEPEESEPASIPKSPIDVRLDLIEIRDAEITLPDRRIDIDRLALSASLQGDRLQLARLELAAPQGSLAAAGRLELSNPYPMELSFDWQASLPETGDAEGSGRLSGDWQRIDLRHTTRGSFGFELNGWLSPDQRTGSIRADWRELRWPLTGEPSYASRSGSLQAEGSLEQLKVRLDVASDRNPLQLSQLRLNADIALDIASEQLPYNVNFVWAADQAGTAIEGKGEVSGTRQTVRLRHEFEKPFLVLTEANAELKPEAPTFEVSGNWQNLRWPLSGPPTVESREGRYSTSGTPADYKIVVSAHLAGGQLPPADLDLKASGSTKAFQIDALDVATLGGRLQARGEAEFVEPPRFDVRLKGENLNPGLRWPDYAGSIALDAKASGTADAFQAQLSSLSGMLRGQSVSGNAKLDRIAAGYRLHGFNLGFGKNTIAASGTLSDSMQLSVQLSAPDLKAIAPGLDGKITAKAQLRGSPQAPAFEASLEGDLVTYQDYGLDHLNLTANYDAARESGNNVVVTISGLRLAEHRVESAKVDLNGGLESHRLLADLHGSFGTGSLMVEGGYDGKTWSGALARAQLTGSPTGDWRLTEKSPMRASQSSFAVENLCLRSVEAQLCADARSDDATGLTASGSARSVPWALLNPFLPEGVAMQGAANADFKFARIGKSAPEISANLQSRAGGLRQAEAEAENAGFFWREMRLNVKAEREIAQLDFALETDTSDFLKANLKAKDYTLPEAALSGEVRGRFAASGLLGPWTPDVQWRSGTLAVDMTIGGTRSEPAIRGEAGLKDAAASVPNLGLELRDLRLVALANGDRRIAVQGGALSGEGHLNIDGEIRADPVLGWPLRLEVKGENFQLAHLADFAAAATPDLLVESGKTGGQVSGRVRLDTLDIKVRELPKNTISVSPDQHIAGETEDKAARSPFLIRVEVEIPDTASLMGFGLETRLAGELSVRQDANAPMAVLGQLQLEDGLYSAFGQKLTITRGRFIFAGTAEDPGVDIEAEREAGEVTAGLKVTGTLRSPVTEVYSRPSLPETEALSYLLTGKPLSELGSGEGSLLTTAALALGARGANPYAKRLGGAIGLDELSLQTGGGVEETGLALGKQVSPKLSLKYVYGLFQRVGAVLLQYQLTKTLSLEAQTGEAQTVDLLYKLERN